MAGNVYETDRSLGEYLLFHYGSAEEVLPYPFGPAAALNFAARIVEECVGPVSSMSPASRGLDLGCAVGRSAFELARSCHEVVGIDFSRSFIQAATTLAGQGHLPYLRVDEGRLTTACDAFVPPGIDRSRAKFEVGDACELRDGLGLFDVVLLVNLLDRLPEPRRCLDRLPGLMASGGQLVISSPFTWLEEFTPRENWLGGFLDGDRPVRSFETLREILEPDFIFEREADVPFLIREHERKFQWSVSHAGMWRRR